MKKNTHYGTINISVELRNRLKDIAQKDPNNIISYTKLITDLLDPPQKVKPVNTTYFRRKSKGVCTKCQSTKLKSLTLCEPCLELHNKLCKESARANKIQRGEALS